MNKNNIAYSVANPGNVLTKSTFNNYDLCLNTYVGCEFGCSYCYVRFFVKDDKKEWGEFVRIREHITDRLPKELDKGNVRIATGSIKDGTKKKTLYRNIMIQDARLVLGTMTDPYQPAEAKHRITRKTIEIITNHPNQLKKVGIFTRSPIILQDIKLIQKLPNARIHFTITPFPQDILRKIEPVSPITAARFKVLQKIKDAGIRIHANISPVIPILSDPYVDDFAEKLANIGVDEFFVDPMQPYKDSYDSFAKAMAGTPKLFDQVKEIMDNKDNYNQWKTEYAQKWTTAWQKHQHKSPNTLPIWSDHVNKTWIDMRTGTHMDRRNYAGE